MSEKHSYRQVFKATGLFGGVQVFNIIIGFIRNKVVAVLLGADGMGINALFTSAINMITSFTNMGLNYSAVRNISQATESGDQEIFSRTVITFRRWMWVSGLLGTIITLVLSPLLSEWTFGNKNYTWSFIWISIVFLLNCQSGSSTTLLHGMRKLKAMANANILGSVLGLCISLPLYYFMGVKGIVPAIIITAISSVILGWYFTRNISVQPLSISPKESFYQGVDMVKLGIMTTLSAFAWNAINYLVNAFVSQSGGLHDVGFYQAAHSLTNQAVNLVFTAMIVDYYPRLSGIQHDTLKVRETVNQQVEVTALLITPLMLGFMTFLPLAIYILYTPEFMPIIGYIQWYFLSTLFKSTYWSMGYIIMAKGDTLLYLITEVSSCLLFAIMGITGYHFFGLKGLGAAYLVSYFCFCFIYYGIVHKKYHFVFTGRFLKVLLIQFLFSVTFFMALQFGGYPVASYVGGILLIGSGIYSYKEINKRIDIKEIIRNKLHRS